MSQSQTACLSTLFAILLNVATCVPANAQEINWKRYPLAEGAFSVRFPVAPRESSRKIADGMEAHEASCNLCNGQIAISIIPNRPGDAWHSESLAESLLKTQRSHGSDSKLLFLNKTKYNGKPSAEIGYTFTVQGETLYVRERIVAMETGRAQISLLSTLTDPVEAWLGDYFFNSLEVASPAQGASSATK
ncbi:hypothetical protein SH139x_001085 [Planctomycetaceae bacterium SH139]